jgi:Ca-activated chloride channel family protein
MKKFTLLFLITISLAPLTTNAQSGRKGTKESPAKTDTKTDARDSQSSISTDNIPDSRTPAGGETVEGDVIRVDTSLVTVPVTVADRNGRYVPSLRREDFHIFEDGAEQRIAYFAAVDQPFTVVLMIDTSGSTQFRLEDIQDAAINFVGKLKSEDSVMVMSFDDSIDILCRPTTDRNAITRAIHRTHTGGGTRLYDAVDAVLMKHLRTITGRKAVVLFTDGVDTTSRHSYEGTVHEAEESDAPIYTVDYDTSGAGGGLGKGWPLPGRGSVILGLPFPRPGGGGGGGGGGGASPGDYRRASRYLHDLSDTTGGRFYSADSLMGISQAFSWIAEELGRQYSLGYYPKTVGQNGQRRQIKVRVNEPDLVVKARDSYIYSDKKSNANHPSDKQPYLSGKLVR